MESNVLAFSTKGNWRGAVRDAEGVDEVFMKGAGGSWLKGSRDENISEVIYWNQVTSR